MLNKVRYGIKGKNQPKLTVPIATDFIKVIQPEQFSVTVLLESHCLPKHQLLNKAPCGKAGIPLGVIPITRGFKTLTGTQGLIPRSLRVLSKNFLQIYINTIANASELIYFCIETKPSRTLRAGLVH